MIKGDTTQALCFSVTGEFLTQHARDRQAERGWDDAIRFLTESLDGCTADHAMQVLRGRMRIVGDSRNDDVGLEQEEPATSAKVAAAECELYAGYVREGSTWWRPYATVTSWARRDAEPGESQGRLSRYGPVLEEKPPSGRDRAKEWRATVTKARSMHYARNPTADRAEICKGTVVLFKRVDPPPWWWEAAAGWDEALDEMRKRGWGMEELGAAQYEPDPVKHTTSPGLLMPLGFDLPDVEGSSRFDPEAVAGTLAAIRGDAPSPPNLCDPEKAQNGYILPEGQVYSCLYHGHRDLASALLREQGKESDDPEKEADRLGWIRLQRSALGGTLHGLTCRRPTDRQRHAWEEWCAFHKVDPDSLQELEPGDDL